MSAPPTIRSLWTGSATLSSAALVGALMGATKLLAAAKIVLAAQYIGAGDPFDAYLTAFLLPSLLADAITAAFTAGLVPALIGMRDQNGVEAERRMARAALSVALLAMGGCVLLLAMGSTLAVRLLGSNFDAAKSALAVRMFLLLLLWLPLGAWIATLRGVLHSQGRFGIAAAAQAITHVLAIVLLISGAGRFGVWILIAAVLGGAAMETAVLIFATRTQGYAIFPGRFSWTPELRSLVSQCRPLLVAAGLTATGALVDQPFAGALESGSVSALSFGTKLPGVLTLICSAGLATVVLPKFSTLATLRQWPSLAGMLKRYAAVSAVAMLPLTALVLWQTEALVRFFFERGAFDPAYTPLVAAVQRFAVAELPFAVIFGLVSQTAVAVSFSHLLAQTGWFALGFKIAASWYLSEALGVPGLALATSLTRVFALVLLGILLFRRRKLIQAGVSA